MELLTNPCTIVAAKSIGPEILEGLVNALDGEKDPRCLSIGLKIIGYAQTNFASSVVGDIAERLFEACACYFPITFQPPPDDPFGITPEVRYDG